MFLLDTAFLKMTNDTAFLKMTNDTAFLKMTNDTAFLKMTDNTETAEGSRSPYPGTDWLLGEPGEFQVGRSF